MTANAPLAVASTKQILVLGQDWREAEAWERQRLLIDVVVASADAREGSEAFLQKRAPVWRGE